MDWPKDISSVTLSSSLSGSSNQVCSFSHLGNCWKLAECFQDILYILIYIFAAKQSVCVYVRACVRACVRAWVGVSTPMDNDTYLDLKKSLFGVFRLYPIYTIIILVYKIIYILLELSMKLQ